MSLLSYSPEEIQAFVQKVQSGAYEEYELLYFIGAALLTPEQVQWLQGKGLTVADVLNGRWKGFYEDEILSLYKDWNHKCGTQLFKLG
jgi:hypothetical protein